MAKIIALEGVMYKTNGKGMYWDEAEGRWRRLKKPSRTDGRETRARVLDAVCNFIDEHGYPPSVRDVCKGADIPSTSHAWFHLRVLRAEGYISYDDGLARTIRVVRRKYDTHSIR